MAPFSISHLTGLALLLSASASNATGVELEVNTIFPAAQSTNVCADTPLRLAFHRPVRLGSGGRIAVYTVAGDKPADAFDLADPAFTNNVGGKVLRDDPVVVAGDVVTIQLHSHALRPGQNYYVRMEPGTISGEDGSKFEGFLDKTAWTFSTRPALPAGRTNLVVATDGHGDFCTPQGAVDYVPDDNQTPVEIFVRKGLYNGLIYIAPDKSHIHFRGEDREETIIAARNNDRINASRNGRALMNVDANDFTLENITLRNTTPYKGSQAEALRLRSERCVLRNDNFYSFQDTLLLSGSVYVTNCHVEGDVDFIWGQGSAFFNQCEIKAVHNGYYLQARNPSGRAGYVFYCCRLTGSPSVNKCLLARIDADRFPFSQAVFIQCQMGPQVPAMGWEVKGTNTSHLCFAEFRSIDSAGNAVDVSQRHPASRQLAEQEAVGLSDPAKVLSISDSWNPRRPEGAQISK